MVCPVAGASTSTRSASRFCSICLILPSTRMSRIPGMAPATRSMIPDDSRRLENRRIPWSSRYSRRASSGVIVRAWTVPGGITADSSTGPSPRSVAPAAWSTSPA